MMMRAGGIINQRCLSMPHCYLMWQHLTLSCCRTSALSPRTAMNTTTPVSMDWYHHHDHRYCSPSTMNVPQMIMMMTRAWTSHKFSLDHYHAALTIRSHHHSHRSFSSSSCVSSLQRSSLPLSRFVDLFNRISDTHGGNDGHGAALTGWRYHLRGIAQHNKNSGEEHANYHQHDDDIEIDLGLAIASDEGPLRCEIDELVRKSIDSGNKDRRYYSTAFGYICRFNGRGGRTRWHSNNAKHGMSNLLNSSSNRSQFFEKAVMFFDCLHREGIDPDVHMYTQLVSSLCRQGNVRYALIVMQMMQRNGVTPNEFTFTSVVAACARHGNLYKANQVLLQMKEDGVMPDVVTYTALVQAHATQGDIDGCLSIISTMKEEGLRPNIVTFTSLILAYTNANRIDDANALFQDLMTKHGVRPNTYTYVNMLNAYGKIGNVDMVLRLFDEMRERSRDPRFDVRVNDVVFTNVLKALIAGNCLEEAEKLLRESCHRYSKKTYHDGEVISSSSATLGRRTNVEKSSDCYYDDEPKANAISFTILCDAYGRIGNIGKVEDLLMLMLEQGIQPDVVAYSTLIRAYCKQKNIDAALDVIKYRMKKEGRAVASTSTGSQIDPYPTNKGSAYIDPNALVFCTDRDTTSSVAAAVYPNQLTYNIILNTLSEMGRPDEAEQIVRMMVDDGVKPDVVTYNTIIGAYSNVGMFVKARAAIEEMIHSGLQPDIATFATLMAAYCRWEMFEDAIELIELMEDHYRLTPTRFIYTLLINELRSKGRFNLAITEFYKMTLAGIEPDIWNYNMLIDCHSKLGSADDIYKVIDSMERSGIKPNYVTLNSLIGCIVKGFIELSGEIRYSECSTSTAPTRRKRKDHHRHHELDGKVTTNKVLDCSCCDVAWNAVQSFWKKYDVKPDATTFNYILTCYGRGKNIEAGRKVIDCLNTLKVHESECNTITHRETTTDAASVSDVNTRNIILKYYGKEEVGRQVNK